MKVVKPPHRENFDNLTKIFLAGSIEEGVAEEWQDRVADMFTDTDNLVLFNPRRDMWNKDWVQSIENKDFLEQVEWELDMLEYADYIILYFDPNTKSPISLLELGLNAKTGKLYVMCPEGFWRKGNVDVVCARYGFKNHTSLESLVQDLKADIKK